MIKKRVRKDNNVNLDTICLPVQNNDLELDAKERERNIETTKIDKNKEKLKEDVEKQISSHLVKLPTIDTKDILSKREDIKEKYFDTIAAVKANRIKKHFSNPVDVDYNPSICKDFHDSGYCSWGDTCIYAHDRTNYKRGWEMNKEWEDQQKELKNKQLKKFLQSEKINFNNQSDESQICKNCFNKPTDPVLTECDHLFCEKCILDEYKITKKCPLCKFPLKGIFRNTNLKKN